MQIPTRSGAGVQQIRGSLGPCRSETVGCLVVPEATSFGTNSGFLGVAGSKLEILSLCHLERMTVSTSQSLCQATCGQSWAFGLSRKRNFNKRRFYMGEGRRSFHGKVELLRESLLIRFTRGDPGEPAVGTRGGCSSCSGLRSCRVCAV